MENLPVAVGQTPPEGIVTEPRVVSAEENPACVYLARLAEGSRRAMRQALERCAGIMSRGTLGAGDFPWERVRYQHTAALRERLREEGLAHSTVNKALSAVRGVLKECFRLGLVSAEDYQRAADVESVKGERLPAGRALSPGELRALFEACARDPRPAARRDAALLAVAYSCGLRRAELVKLDLGNVDCESGELRVRLGKGNKERAVFVVNGALEAVAAWLEVQGLEPGPLFSRTRKGGGVEPAVRLSTQAVFRAFKRRAREAGIREFSPHDLRRTCAGDLLDSGADLVTVQKILGHSSPATTSRYDRRLDKAKKTAAAKLHLPFE